MGSREGFPCTPHRATPLLRGGSRMAQSHRKTRGSPGFPFDSGSILTNQGLSFHIAEKRNTCACTHHTQAHTHACTHYITHTHTHRHTRPVWAHIHHIPLETPPPLLLTTWGCPPPSRCPALQEDKTPQGHSGYTNKMTFKLVRK